MHVIQYLQGLKDCGLFYGQCDGDAGLVSYSDSDWAGTNSRCKSIGRFIFQLAGSPISWQSKKQTCMVTSLNKTEYMAALETAKEVC